MDNQALFVTKKMGRPRKEPTALVRLPVAALEAVDAWVACHPDPKLTRPEAIRRLVEHALKEPPR